MANGGPSANHFEEHVRRWVALAVITQFIIVVGGLMGLILYAEGVLNATIPSEAYTVLGIILTGEVQALQSLLSHYFRPLTSRSNGPPAASS